MTNGRTRPPDEAEKMAGKEEPSRVDAKIHTYLRAAAGLRRTVERVDPFLVSFDPHSANTYRNYAIPDDGAEPVPNQVRALIGTFERRRRVPRLEYVPSASPHVEMSLLAAGFAVEVRMPLMIVVPRTARPLPIPLGIELVMPVGGEGLRDAASAQNVAYGEPTTTSHDVERLRTTLAAGGIVVSARDATSGRTIGAGLCSAPIGGVTEIAAIGVVPAWRRRGVAGAICSQLVSEAFAARITMPFLMPAGPAEERIYARAGFARVSEILHVSQPRPRG